MSTLSLDAINYMEMGTYCTLDKLPIFDKSQALNTL